MTNSQKRQVWTVAVFAAVGMLVIVFENVTAGISLPPPCRRESRPITHNAVKSLDTGRRDAAGHRRYREKNASDRRPI